MAVRWQRLIGVALLSPSLLVCSTTGHAQVGLLSDAFTLNGNAIITTDHSKPTGAACADSSDPAWDTSPSMDLTGGCGSFSFNGATTGASDSEGTDLEQPGNGSVSLGGEFDNEVCGTGDAEAYWTVTAGVDAGATAGISITFIDGQGTLIGASSDPFGDPGVDNLTGTITLIPGNAGDDALDCVSSFTVAGNIVATEADGG